MTDFWGNLSFNVTLLLAVMCITLFVSVLTHRAENESQQSDMALNETVFIK